MLVSRILGHPFTSRICASAAFARVPHPADPLLPTKPTLQRSANTLGVGLPHRVGIRSIETASLLRANGTFQYLTGLPSKTHLYLNSGHRSKQTSLEQLC